MQNLPAHGGTGDLCLGDRVVVRQQRWRVSAVEPHRNCAIVTLAGNEPSNAGTRQRILTPFETVERLDASPRLRLVSRRRWRRACRALLAESAGPEFLHSSVDARIELLPHQLEPALAVVKGLGTRVLLADAVGLGKTIETGLILAELLARGAATRVLVLTPAGLREQWIEELSAKFALSFTLADASAIRGFARRLSPGLNPWTAMPLAVASYDFVKRPGVEAAVRQCHWDAIVVDEAHSVVQPSDRHAAVARLCRTAPYVVLLTATPHNGDPQSFASLLQIGGTDAPLIFRRTRAEVGLANERRVHQLVVKPSSAERTLHARLLRFTQAVEREHRDEQSALALSVLRKRALSSAHAIGQSVRRRLAAMDGPVETFPRWQPQLPFDGDDESEPTDDVPAWTVPILSDARQERRLLLDVAAAAEHASRDESKLRVLGRLLKRIARPAIVFTEYRDTLMHVRTRVAPEAAVLHGGMTRAQRRAALASVGQGTLLLATDAAGEGLNLQRHCHVVINLELPWNPVRLEQRIGRVDRIGQRRRVHAFHLIAGGTHEEQIRHRLRQRLTLAQCAIGADDALGGAERIEADVSPPALHLTRLAADAASERNRIHLARILMKRGGNPAPGERLSGRSGRRGRRALGGRALVVVQSAIQSDVGETIATCVAAALVPIEAIERQLDALVRQLRAPSQGEWATAVRDGHRAFWDVRLAREAVLAAAGPAVLNSQPALFDRRIERDHERAERVRQEQRTALDERRERLRRLAATDEQLRITVLVLCP